MSRGFSRSDLGPNIRIFPIPNEQNFPKFPISYFYILVKISWKSEQKMQLQMHENLH